MVLDENKRARRISFGTRIAPVATKICTHCISTHTRRKAGDGLARNSIEWMGRRVVRGVHSIFSYPYFFVDEALCSSRSALRVCSSCISERLQIL